MGGVEAAHTERRLCSCRLMQWLIEAEPLYSSTTGFEIQHCTWGAMSVPSLSPCINLSFYLPFSDSPPSHSEFLYFWRYVPANSPWHDMPQVGIIASAASGAHLRCCFSVFLEIKQGRMWKFPVEKQEYFQSFWRYRYLMPAGWSRAQTPPRLFICKRLNELFCSQKSNRRLYWATLEKSRKQITADGAKIADNKTAIIHFLKLFILQ